MCVSSAPLPTFWRSSLRLCASCQPKVLDWITEVHPGFWDLHVAWGDTFVAYVGAYGMPGVQGSTGQLAACAVSHLVGSMHRQICWTVGFVCGPDWLVGSVGGLADRVHKPAGRACEMVVKIPVPVAVRLVPFLCSLLPPNYLLVLVASVFWVRGDRSRLIRQCPERLGKLHTRLSLFILQEKS